VKAASPRLKVAPIRIPRGVIPRIRDCDLSQADAQRVGPRLAAVRARRRLTQWAVAQYVGVTQEALSNWERGAALPSFGRIEPLAVALGVQQMDLLHGPKNEKRWLEALTPAISVGVFMSEQAAASLYAEEARVAAELARAKGAAEEAKRQQQRDKDAAEERSRAEAQQLREAADKVRSRKMTAYWIMVRGRTYPCTVCCAPMYYQGGICRDCMGPDWNPGA
jgi:transcriptional regulator with XRE-family HTH domain